MMNAQIYNLRIPRNFQRAMYHALVVVCFLTIPSVCVAQDEAVQESQIAAEQGDAEEQNNLGVKYRDGQGVAQDYEEAVRWFRAAAEQGYADAQYNLAFAYATGKGVPQDGEVSDKWLRAAAEQGHILAQDRLGWMYSYGQGVAQDHEEAARWFRAAAEQGNAHAQRNLGIVYGKGLGVPQDSEEAVRWFRAAAEQGDARAQYNLGLAYRDGEYGVTVDRYAAWEWFTAAARQGNANATEAARGLPVPPHPARAFDIDTGTIWIGGGIEGSRDGTMLFLDLWNKTERSVWAEVEFQLPGTGQLLQEFKRVKGVDGARYSWPIDSVTWSTEYRFRISVFDDKKRRKPLGAEESFYYFDENEAESFEAGWQAGVIEYGGFRELHWESLKAEVPGSLAAGELRYHIMLSLFAEESKLHKECEHTALRAEQYGADDRSIPASEMKPELQKLHSKIRASDKMIIERWFMQSCEAMSVYEVHVKISRRGESDIVHQRLDLTP